jgi:hypothetical protein
MLSTRSIVVSLDEVPSTWIYEYYCKLTEKLTGQSVKMKSLFNHKDTNPSFFIYYKDGKYKWKDFSTGFGGSDVNLVSEMYSLEYPETVQLIIKDYSVFLEKNKNGYCLSPIVEENKYELSTVVTRPWNNLDASYWLQYNVGSETLEKFNVKPIEHYAFICVDKPGFDVRSNYMYGYYNSSNQICKIYRPKSQDYKFIKVRDYLQGTDQLEFKKPYLVICSSLKDAMCIDSMGYPVEVIAPDSENSIIRKEIIDLYKVKYKAICTLLDNDKVGLEAMAKYNALYQIPGIHLKLEKDLSDSVKVHGIETVDRILRPILKNILLK